MWNGIKGRAGSPLAERWNRRYKDDERGIPLIAILLVPSMVPNSPIVLFLGNDLHISWGGIDRCVAL